MSGKRARGGKLSLDDLAKIIEDVHDAVDKWHNIGIQLGLHESELKSIESNYPRQNDRLREMICKWLQNKTATWGKMVSALKSRTVGETYLAEQLESEYCVPPPMQRITMRTTEISRSSEVSESLNVNVLPARSNVPPSTPSPSQSLKAATGSTQKAATFPSATANRKRPVSSTGDVPPPKKVAKASSTNKAPSSFSDDQFVTPQPSELHCVKCKRVPQLPKRSKCCNTLYCDPCSLAVAKCPVHKKQLEYSTDTDLKSRIAKWTIYCENKCGWKGVVHKLKEHLPECTGKQPAESASNGSVSNDPLSITKPAGATISYQASTKSSTTSKAASITLSTAAALPHQPQLNAAHPSSSATEQQTFSPTVNQQLSGMAVGVLPLDSQPSTTAVGIHAAPQMPTGQLHTPAGAGVSSSVPTSQSKSSGGTEQKSSSTVSVDTLYSELKGVSTKWHKLGGVLKIGQLDEIRTMNGNDPDSCLYALLKALVGIKGGSPYKKLCKALESDIIGEKALVEGLKSRYGSTNIRITLKGSTPASSQAIQKPEIKPSTVPPEHQPSEQLKPQPQEQQEQILAQSPIVDPDSFADSDFVNPLPAEQHCVLCKMVPRKPRRSKCCNTLYCVPCSKKQEQCPTHKQKKEYTADSDLRKKVSKLHLHCKRKCGWKGSWAKMKDHLKECGLEKKGGELAVGGGSLVGGAGKSMTITELTTTTTHLHTKTTTIGPSQPPPHKQPAALGGASPQGDVGLSGMGEGQGSSVAQSQKKALIQYRDPPKMDLLYLIKYTRPDGSDHTLKLVDKLAPFWKRVGHLLGISTDQLNTWELMYGNPSSCSEAVLSHFLQNGSQGTYMYPQTWGGVVKLLQDLDLNNLAKELQSIAR